MKRISVAAILITVIWLSFALNGRGLIQGVVAQHVEGYPNIGQVHYYIVFPLIVALVVALSGLCFWFGRLKIIARIFQVVAFVLLLPYLFFYTGGM